MRAYVVYEFIMFMCTHMQVYCIYTEFTSSWDNLRYSDSLRYKSVNHPMCTLMFLDFLLKIPLKILSYLDEISHKTSHGVSVELGKVGLTMMVLDCRESILHTHAYALPWAHRNLHATFVYRSNENVSF